MARYHWTNTSRASLVPGRFCGGRPHAGRRWATGECEDGGCRERCPRPRPRATPNHGGSARRAGFASRRAAAAGPAPTAACSDRSCASASWTRTPRPRSPAPAFAALGDADCLPGHKTPGQRKTTSCPRAGTTHSAVGATARRGVRRPHRVTKNPDPGRSTPVAYPRAPQDGALAPPSRTNRACANQEAAQLMHAFFFCPKRSKRAVSAGAPLTRPAPPLPPRARGERRGRREGACGQGTSPGLGGGRRPPRGSATHQVQRLPATLSIQLLELPLDGGGHGGVSELARAEPAPAERLRPRTIRGERWRCGACALRAAPRPHAQPGRAWGKYLERRTSARRLGARAPRGVGGGAGRGSGRPGGRGRGQGTTGRPWSRRAARGGSLLGWLLPTRGRWWCGGRGYWNRTP